VLVFGLPRCCAGNAGRADANVTRLSLRRDASSDRARKWLWRGRYCDAELISWRERNGPAGFRNAHAQDIMAFRGCRDINADQIAAICAAGRVENADTQQNITQYFTTSRRRTWSWRWRLDGGLHAGRG